MNPPGARNSGIVRPRPLAWHQRWAAAATYGTMRALAMTVRFRCEARWEGLASPRDAPVIFCIWHDRLAFAMEVWRRFALQADRGLAAMVSASKDGGILARVLERFGARAARGSSSRRGRQALLELTTWAEQGLDLAITPDGPRGPRHVAQPGVIYLAQLTGLSIVPVRYTLTRKVTLRSWDRFMVPIPFGVCSVVFANPLRVAREASENELDEARRSLERELGD